jgi:hypothetical protein
MTILPESSLPVFRVRKVRVLVELPTGEEATRTITITYQRGESDAVLLRRAADAYRRLQGYDGRLISIDVTNGD